MITVTLGTIPYRFDRSIDWLQSLLTRGLISEPLFIQYGTSDITPVLDHPLVTAEAVVPQALLKDRVNHSRLVISHGGQGSTRMLATSQVHFTLIPRLAQHGEHVDDHQLLFARSVQGLGVHHCVSLTQLEQALVNPPALCPPCLFEGPKLSSHLLRRYPQSTFSVSSTLVL